MSGHWQFWIDRGGTFTDVVARRPDGRLLTHKLLSENPEHYRDAALQGIRDVLGIGRDKAIPAAQIEAVKMGTTVATNALLERKGDRVLLLITRGFKDALRIAYQNRPRLFVRHIVLPELLYEQVAEIDERIGAGGEMIEALDEDQTRLALEQGYNNGIRAVAIVFLHGYRYPDHERKAAAIAREIGFTQISASSEISPLMKLVGRGDTTVVDAYLTPILRRYVDRVAAELGDTRLLFMQSNGGLADAHFFQGKDSILSGPAGGIVGAVATAAAAGFNRLISFDMGGTSTDVAHYDGEYERAFETLVAGVRMRAPMMRIHTVAAGGGSICSFDGTRFRVGPESAGADPGPACYRRGGPLAVTDCNVMTGKIQPEFFPHVFGPDQNQPLDHEVVEKKFAELAVEIEKITGKKRGPAEIADGFLKIAVENMANAIKQISTQRGYDVTEYVLCCFGGAGGQHACGVADALGMKRVFLHPFAGVLSAYGMGLAELRLMKEHSIEKRLAPALIPELEAVLKNLEDAGRQEMLKQGVCAEYIGAVKKVHLRYQGSDTPLIVDYGPYETIVAGFEAAHRQRYGFLLPDKAHIVEAVAAETVGAAGTSEEQALETPAHGGALKPAAVVPVYTEGKPQQSPAYRREDTRPGDRIDGPAIIIEPNATTVVEPGWQAEVTARNHLVLTRIEPLPKRAAVGTEVDPVMLEVFNNLFMSIAEQMGFALANTAHSVNIKERLDFSCAVFDHEGQLIANAPHMPVHLGSMGESVQAVIHNNQGSIQPGDAYVLNAPYNGGTHLPDVTVITPVFLPSLQSPLPPLFQREEPDTKHSPAESYQGGETGGAPLFYVGSRGHHADIGGITPGSMPPDSRTVDEEGVLIDNFKLVDRGEFREQACLELLRGGPYPVRNPHQNLADLQAQIAANEKGVQELKKMVDHFGLKVVNAYMRHVQDNAEEQVRRVLDVLKPGSFEYEMDNGAVIRVDIDIDKSRRSARVDFSRSSMQLNDNFNAPSAVCKAAVLYVFRTLVEEDIPMNTGCLKPIEIIIPEGSMLNPCYPAAVVAGNVETSQCITDALYGALGVMAAAQGTMNNFTFGNERYQYYETLCGGSGAGPDFDGTSAVHTHMTNSRLTDPEVLELRFPVRVEDFRIREGSGGRGKHRGGDGAVRRIRFLQPMSASILSNHRRIAPFGMAGGEPGALGRNTVIRADGRMESISATASVDIQPGDVFVIETPGGGGYGSPLPSGNV